MKKFAITILTAGALGAGALSTAGVAGATLDCIDSGLATQCASPGNVQITTNAPAIQYQPAYPFLFLGGHHHW